MQISQQHDVSEEDFGGQLIQIIASDLKLKQVK